MHTLKYTEFKKLAVKKPFLEFESNEFCKLFGLDTDIFYYESKKSRSRFQFRSKTDKGLYIIFTLSHQSDEINIQINQDAFIGANDNDFISTKNKTSLEVKRIKHLNYELEAKLSQLTSSLKESEYSEDEKVNAKRIYKQMKESNIDTFVTYDDLFKNIIYVNLYLSYGTTAFNNRDEVLNFHKSNGSYHSYEDISSTMFTEYASAVINLKWSILSKYGFEIHNDDLIFIMNTKASLTNTDELDQILIFDNNRLTDDSKALIRINYKI